MTKPRRDTLKRMIQAGKVVLTHYRYCSDSTYEDKPVANEKCNVYSDAKDAISGVWNIPARVFSGSYGGVYVLDDGSINLYTGSETFTFKAA